MAFLAAVPAIATALGALFGKKKSGGETVPAQTLLPGFQMQSGEQLADYVSKYLNQYQPGKEYTGDFTAGLTGTESTGLNRLNQFLAAPDLGELFKTTKQNVLDTVGGKFSDPNQSPFIQSMVNLSKMNLQDSIDQSRRSAGSRGAYFTKSAIQDENRLRERTNTGLDSIVGDFINQERGRALNASNLAMGLEKYENLDVPLAKVASSQEYGSLPRLIEQADLESRYNDFTRKQGELAGVPSAAGSVFGNNTPYQPSYTNPIVQSNNTLGNILSIISKLNVGGASGGGDIWDKIGRVFKG